MRRTAVVTALCLALAILASTAAWAADVFVDVELNGKVLQNRGLVYGDRTYVTLDDVADVLGGRYLRDRQLNVGFVLTGRYQNLVADKLAQINPDVDGYYPVSTFESGAGVLYGLSGPNLSLVLTPSGIVSGMELIFPQGEVEPRPWFDQQPGKPFMYPPVGQAYSQRLFLMDRGLLQLGGDQQIAFNGKALKVAHEAIYPHDNRLYVRLRDLAEASGGGVGWDADKRVATAKIEPGPDLSWSVLGAYNLRTIHFYGQRAPFTPGFGYRYGADGPGIVVGVDGDNMVTAFEGLFKPKSTPWFPWYDQHNGEPKQFPGFGDAYSQHIYVVQKSEIMF